jgi:hypothetical protein
MLAPSFSAQEESMKARLAVLVDKEERCAARETAVR